MSRPFQKITIYTWITICFPLYLIFFEFMLRHLFNVEISSFIGPSLASSGIGFLLECIKPNKVILSDDLIDLKKALPSEFTVRDTRDEKRVILSWVYIVVCSAIWVYICSISIKPTSQPETNLYSSNYWFILGLGTMNYIIGITLLFSKETYEGRTLQKTL